MDNVLEIVRGLFSDQTSNFIDAIRSHPRYHLRSIAITAATFGSVLNFLVLFACVVGRVNKTPSILTGCAYIPLILSLAWHSLDLTSRQVFRQEIAPIVLTCVDAFGFLGFLTILIANGIVCSHLRYFGGLVVFMAYDSVPWMVCW